MSELISFLEDKGIKIVKESKQEPSKNAETENKDGSHLSEGVTKELNRFLTIGKTKPLSYDEICERLIVLNEATAFEVDEVFRIYLPTVSKLSITLPTTSRSRLTGL